MKTTDAPIKLLPRFGGGSATVKGAILSLHDRPLFAVHEMTKPLGGFGPRYYHVTHIPTECWIARYKQKGQAVEDCKLIIQVLEDSGHSCEWAFATDSRILSLSPFYHVGGWLLHKGRATKWPKLEGIVEVDLAFARRKMEQLKEQLNTKETT